MTEEKEKKIVRGIADKIEATTDIDDWAEFWGFTRAEYEEFLETAIHALQIVEQLEKNCENCGNYDVPVVCSEGCVDRCNWIPKKTEPCEDAVSRQAVIDITAETGALETQRRVMELPSVQPKAREGRWLHRNDDHNDWSECSECGYGDEGEVKFGKETPYCPYCGSRNKGENEDRQEANKCKEK